MRVLVTVMLGLVFATPTASAAGGLPAQLVVASGNARAIVDTAQFRLTFQRADTGAVVLQEVQGDGVPKPGAQLFPVLLSVRPPGDGAPVYEPLGYQVGGAANAQTVPGETTGNETITGQAGLVVPAGSVTKADAVEGGFRLTVATGDPSRALTVDVTPDTGSAIRVRAHVSDAAGIAGFADSFIAPAGEGFHGFGGRHNSVDQRGAALYSWPEQEAIDCGVVDASAQDACAQIPGGGGEGYELGGGAAQTYYPQNHFVSSRGYSFLVDTPFLTRWRMAADDPAKWQVAVAGPTLDYSVVVGHDLPGAVRGLTDIVGSQIEPPDWALGATLSRAWNVVSDSTAKYHDEILADLKHIEQDHLPVKAYAYEAWRSQEPKFVKQVNDRLRAEGIHAIGYVRAFLHVDAFNTQQQFDEADRKGYGSRDPSGRPEQFGCNYGPNCILIDFSNPAARKWWQQQIRDMLDLGFDGFMQDFGEQVTSDMRFYDGSTGDEMHNRYPVLYHRTTREVLDQYTREHPDRQLFMYTRAGYSGAGDGSRKGTVAYDNGSFPGDETTSWTKGTGLPSIFPDMLNRSVGGGLGYDSDLGGYTSLPGGYGDQPDTEMYLRWHEAGVFMPYFRTHNADIHMPWDTRLDKTTEAKWTALAELHNRAVPLLAKLWREYPKTGIPPSAPLWLMAPGDANTARISDEWMVGRDLLVAPVIEKGATRRSVYFPAGCWRDPETGSDYAGGASHDVAAPLDKLPWFERCGEDPLAQAAVQGEKRKHRAHRRRARHRPRTAHKRRTGHARTRPAIVG